MTSAGWLAPSFATFDSLTSASTSSVSRSASATIAPEAVEMFTPGGIGATLSPISAIFFTTTPLNGARISVFCSSASFSATSACDCRSAASDTRTRDNAASRSSSDNTFSRASLSASCAWRRLSARSASARCTCACARCSCAS